MIAVSVCKHSQGRHTTIIVHKGHCHLFMASKNKYQTYQWTHFQRWHLILFLTDTHIKEYRLVGQHYLSGVITDDQTYFGPRARSCNIFRKISGKVDIHGQVDQQVDPWSGTWERCKGTSRRLPQIHLSRIISAHKVIHKNDANFMFANRYKNWTIIKTMTFVCLSDPQSQVFS